MDSTELPLSDCAFTAGFRSQAGAVKPEPGGSAPRNPDIELELVKICRPDESKQELTDMAELAQQTLQQLGLPYRVMLRGAPNLSPASSQTLALEVWMPGHEQYAEISACSNCTDYLARRLNIRYRETADAPPKLCHTLHSSGLLIGLAMAAILENHQNADGSVTVPEPLRPYLHENLIR